MLPDTVVGVAFHWLKMCIPGDLAPLRRGLFCFRPAAGCPKYDHQETPLNLAGFQSDT